jgi:ribonuclease T1
VRHTVWLLLAFVLGFAGCERALVEEAPTRARVEVVATPSNAEVVATPSNDALPGLVQIADAAERAAVVAMVGRIQAGGPFAYPDRDGSVFNNYERRLPLQPRGHYREYTVATPGLDHRGARRIVAGRTAEMYYTRDHYTTFVRLTP